MNYANKFHNRFSLSHLFRYILISIILFCGIDTALATKMSPATIINIQGLKISPLGISYPGIPIQSMGETINLPIKIDSSYSGGYQVIPYASMKIGFNISKAAGVKYSNDIEYTPVVMPLPIDKDKVFNIPFKVNRDGFYTISVYGIPVDKDNNEHDSSSGGDSHFSVLAYKGKVYVSPGDGIDALTVFSMLEADKHFGVEINDDYTLKHTVVAKSSYIPDFVDTKNNVYFPDIVYDAFRSSVNESGIFVNNLDNRPEYFYIMDTTYNKVLNDLNSVVPLTKDKNSIKNRLPNVPVRTKGLPSVMKFGVGQINVRSLNPNDTVTIATSLQVMNSSFQYITFT